jgi:biopolymer transport protein ExbD
VSYSQLREELSKLHTQSPESQIAIDADENVEHRIVVKIMDLIEGVGFRRIGIVTSPAQEQP